MRGFKVWLLTEYKEKRIWLSVLGGCLYSLMLVFGYHLTYHNSVFPIGYRIQVMAELLIAAVALAAILLAAFYGMENVSTKPKWQEFFVKRKAFFVIWAIIFLCWIPFWLSSYPGIFSYDSNLQFNWYFTGYRSSHHPLIHTYMLGGLVDLGNRIFGSYQAGAVLYALTQMLIMSALFAAICTFLGKNRAPWWLIIGAVLFYGVYPANAYLCMTATKDSIFSALFGFYFAQLLTIKGQEDAFFHSKKRMGMLIVTACLMMMLRNNLMYMLIIGFPFFVGYYRKHWKGALIVMLVPLFLIKVYTGPVYDALQVESVDSREAYNAVIQTISRVYQMAPEDFSEEEKELLFSVIPEEYIVRYVPHKGDEVRWGFQTPAFSEHFIEFMRMWVQKGLAHPLIYIDGFFSTNFGLWYPWDVLPDETTIRVYVEYFFGTETKEILNIRFDPKLGEKAHEISYAICQDSVLTRIPILGGLIFGAGSFFWLVVFVTLFLLRKQKWGLLFTIMIPLWGYFLTLLFGPVACMRYMYPYMTTMPLLIYTMIKDRV